MGRLRIRFLATLVLILITSQLIGCTRYSYAPVAPGPGWIWDLDIGYTIGVNEFNTGLPLSRASAAKRRSTIRNGSVVAVHVPIGADNGSWAQVHITYFTLLCYPIREPLLPVTTGDFDNDLKAAGYTPWIDPPPGGAVNGWITYIVPGIRNPDYCFLLYNRPELLSPDGTTIRPQNQSYLLTWMV